MAPGCARAPRRLLPLPRLPLLLPLLLLLLLLQVTTMAKLPSPQHGQLDRAQPCRSGEYWSDGQCCQLCPAGEYVSQACVSPHTRGSCVKCEPGTFTAWANGLPACQPCSTCRERQEVVAECSSTQDRLCRCRRGHFYQQLESYETCTLCTNCVQGTGWDTMAPPVPGGFPVVAQRPADHLWDTFFRSLGRRASAAGAKDPLPSVGTEDTPALLLVGWIH
ncbi:tumor necrosis factor receptor superfamily member 1A-like [Thomomys bottae]